MALNPIIPLAGAAGALILFLTSKKSSATPPGSTQTPAPSGTSNTAPMPAALLQKVQTALGRLGVSPATGQLSGAAKAVDVAYGQQVTNELSAAGYLDVAKTLQSYVSQAAAMLPGPYSTPSTPTAPSGPRPTSELSDAQRERMAEALGRLGVSPATGKLSGAADAEAIRFATQVVGELDAAGFKDAAKALRGYVDEASKVVKTPTEAAPIATAAQAAGLTKEQAEYAARVLALERDPNKIGIFIDWLKKLPPTPQRDTFIQMAQALAFQLAAANITTNTLDQINQVITSSPEAPDEEPVYTTPASTATRPPATTSTPSTAPPEQPVKVPATPVPQAVPKPLSEIELVGRSLLNNLIATQKKYGVKAAKGKEDRMLVKKFQGLAGLTADGNAGPATLLILATKGALELPLVYYWPKTATAATVAEYRTALENIAKKHEQLGSRDQANTLRVSIAREHGEGGINGPLFGAPAVSTSKPPVTAVPKPAATTAPKPAAAPPKPSNVVSIVPGDPTPGARILTIGIPKGNDVVAWQQGLARGFTFSGMQFNYASLVGKPDGIFGNGTANATKAFQKQVGLTPVDGKVGPATRAKAHALGMI